MPHSQNKRAHEAFAVGEVLFANASGFLEELATLEVGKTAHLSFDFHASKRSAEVFGDAAAFMALAAGANAEKYPHLPLFATGLESSVRHPLEWFSVTEKTANASTSVSHKWYLYPEKGNTLSLTFVHGLYGHRHEPVANWAAGFLRLSELIGGYVTWHQFGDAHSRNTLLGKGQFYWREPAADAEIPVDNFVFNSTCGYEFTVAGVSHRCALSVEGPQGIDGCEWHDDYAKGLARLADVLEGSISPSSIGEATKSCAAGTTGPGPGARPMSGRFFVKSVYAQGDVLPAPALTYRTKEGDSVTLRAVDIGWSVSTNRGPVFARLLQFPESGLPGALRAVSALLNGRAN